MDDGKRFLELHAEHRPRLTIAGTMLFLAVLTLPMSFVEAAKNYRWLVFSAPTALRIMGGIFLFVGVVSVLGWLSARKSARVARRILDDGHVATFSRRDPTKGTTHIPVRFIGGFSKALRRNFFGTSNNRVVPPSLYLPRWLTRRGASAVLLADEPAHESDRSNAPPCQTCFKPVLSQSNLLFDPASQQNPDILCDFDSD